MKYLSEVMRELPKNCLFNKGKVGCGGTTLALNSDKNYVICVPFQSLIKNKMAQYPEGYILGVMAGVSAAEIKDYVETVDNKKIMVTYDSLPRLMKYINPKEYNILIDEYHILLTQYCFRDRAISGVLDNYKAFNEYTFMSATPIEEDFILKELTGMKVVDYDWGKDKIVVNVMTVKCKDVMASTIRLIKSFLCGEIEGNAYLFLNSVTCIKELVKACKLTNENTRVIYSKNNRTEVGIVNGDTTDEPKKINLLTSTCFEGCDIYDEDGKTYIISDPSFEHSLIDIITSIQQIASRIRNSKYTDTVYHLYKNTRYSCLSYEEFKEYQQKEEEEAKIMEKEMASLSDLTRCNIEVKDCDIRKTADSKFVFEPNLLKVDTYNFKVLENYSVNVNINDVYKAYNIDTAVVSDITKMKELEIERPIKISFKEAVKKIRDTKDIVERETLTNLYNQDYPFLSEAIEKLGFERIESFRYVQKEIKSELLRLQDSSMPIKICSQLRFKAGEFVSLKDVKKKLQAAFDTLELNRKAKSTDLREYYDVDTKNPRINGKTVSGYVILRCRYRDNK